MKKAKFALTAIAVLAVVGGALAFKANRIGSTFYKFGTTVANGPTGCLIPVSLKYVPDESGEILSSYSSATLATTAAAGCQVRVVANA